MGGGIFSDYSVAVFGNGALAAEGIKAVASFSAEEIRLSVKRGVVTVYGANLEISELGGGCAYIKGRLSKIEFL
jgi:sporulation protein YqfC